MVVPVREWKNYISDDSPICIREITIKNGERIYPHTHDHAEFFFVMSGKMIHFLNGKKSIMKPRTAQFIFPDYVHSLELAHGVREASWINISFPLSILTKDLNEMIIRLSFKEKNDAVSLPTLSMPNWELYMSKINFLLENHDKTQQEILFRNILMDLLIIYFQMLEKPADPCPNWLTHAMQEMEKDENFIMGLERFIELSGKTQNHLTKQIKKHHGITPTQYINRLRLQKAESLLKNTDIAITDVVYESGFQNMSYFYERFKAKNNMRPIQYRNKFHQKD